MEIIFDNVTYSNKLKNIDFKTDSNLIGIYGFNKEYLGQIISAKYKITTGHCYLNKTEITKENATKIRKKVAYISEFNSDNYNVVIEEIEKLLLKKNYKSKDLDKKINESLKIFNLKEDIIYRKIDTLSSSEKKLLSLAINLIYNPQIIIIDEPFMYLDYINKKRLLKTIKLLTDTYNKTIIILTNDLNDIYKYTTTSILLNNNTLLKIGQTDKIFKEVDTFINNKIPLPDLIKFTYLAKEKNIRLMYHRDIRDLIKDIYKHV